MANAIASNLPGSVPAPRYAIDRVAAKIEPRLRALFRRLPAGVSLVTGGVFILVTVFLPLAIDGCGGYAGTGRDLAAGEPDTYWPGLIEFATPCGHWFYRFLLTWAALAVVAALVVHFKRELSARRQPLLLLTALAGVISLYVIADFAAWTLFLIGVSDETRASAAEFTVALAAYIALRAAWARPVRSSLPLRLIFLILGALTTLLAALGAYCFATGTELSDSSPMWMLVIWLALVLSPFALCVLGPLALWLRHSLWPMADSSVYWPGTRRVVVLAYAPLVAAQFWIAFQAIFRYHVWGLVPCLAGIHLITLGYLRLARSAETLEASAVRVPSGQPLHASCAAGFFRTRLP